MKRCARACVLLLLLLGTSAQAVVHSTGDGTGTITAPADDPGFDHVGIAANGLSAVYIGNRWMLTAAHVGEQALTLGGVTYAAVPGSLIQLQFAPGIYSDLVLVRLATEPPLPPLVLSSTTPVSGNNVTMIGRAWDRAAAQICWNASYVEVGCGPFVAHRGFKADGTGTYRTRWGRNLVEATGVDVTMGSWTTRGFEVAFDQAGVSYEAQGVPGDSGGAVFLKRGSQWELVGVMFAITIHEEQPYYTTAMFGQSTYAADIAWYFPQIEAIVSAPEIPLLPAPLFALCVVLLAGLGGAALSRRAR
jgi:hypothetical protein